MNDKQPDEFISVEHLVAWPGATNIYRGDEVPSDYYFTPIDGSVTAFAAIFNLAALRAVSLMLWSGGFIPKFIVGLAKPREGDWRDILKNQDICPNCGTNEASRGCHCERLPEPPEGGE